MTAIALLGGVGLFLLGMTVMTDGLKALAGSALQRDGRGATLAAVAPGKLTAVDVFALVDANRRLDRIAHHAWRSAAHRLGRGAPDEATAA